MTEQLALQYAALRAERFGWRDYDFQPKVLNVPSNQKRVIDSNDQLHLLIEVNAGVSVSSQTGFWDVMNPTVNEQSEEFTGSITIHNRTNALQQIRFLQVIPRHETFD